MKTLAAFLAVVALATPAAAQDPDVLTIRGVAFASVQSFAANTTFNAVFGSSTQPFFGGGVSLTERGYFLDVTASRFKKTGERVVRFDNENFRLGIPLTTTITPLEFAFGYRFRRHSSIIPYAGGGVGRYAYKETSDFSDASENVDTSHIGYLALGGAEFRLSRWIGLAGEVQFTRVTGILGEAGLSKDVGEKDLGGVAGRFKVVVGR